MPFSFIAPTAGLFDAWFDLYRHYGISVGDPVDRKTAGIVWRWLLDGTHRVAGILAIDEKRDIVGFVHYRPFPRTLHGNEACFIDDLFVAEGFRGRGLGTELIARVTIVAEKRGWSEIRWVTSPENDRAIDVYDRVAERSDLITYRKKR